MADVKLVVQILQVLEYFADHQRPARVVDMYGVLGVPSSTTFKILGAQNDTKVMTILALPPPLGMERLHLLCRNGANKASMMLKSNAEASLPVRRLNAEMGDPHQWVPIKAFVQN